MKIWDGKSPQVERAVKLIVFELWQTEFKNIKLERDIMCFSNMCSHSGNFGKLFSGIILSSWKLEEAKCFALDNLCCKFAAGLFCHKCLSKSFKQYLILN